MPGLIMRSSDRITRAELVNVETPLPTDSWRPVPHYEVAELVTRTAAEKGYNVVSEEYGINMSGRRMFGVLKFAPEGHPEYTRALGIRNSHDKRFALGLVVGVSVTVCSNLMFSGSGTTIHRKHTSRIEISELIPGAFDRLAEEYEKLEENIARLKTEHVGDDDARIITVNAAEVRAIPSCDILTVLKEFQSPRHEEFREPTRWSLYNSFTETAKKYSPARADQCYQRLAKMFDLA